MRLPGKFAHAPQNRHPEGAMKAGQPAAPHEEHLTAGCSETSAPKKGPKGGPDGSKANGAAVFATTGGHRAPAHHQYPDRPLLALVAGLFFLGQLLKFSLGQPGEAEKQLLIAVLAVAVWCAAYFVGFTVLGKAPKLLFLALCAVTVAAFFFSRRSRGMPVDANYILLLFPAVYAGFVYGMRNKGYRAIVVCSLVFLFPLICALLVPNSGVFFLLVVSYLAITTAAVVKGWFQVKRKPALLLVFLPALFFTGTWLLIELVTCGTGRLGVVLHPALDPQGAGYVDTVTRQLISAARLVGKGRPVEGVAANEIAQALPGIRTDHLLTYVTYLFGWVALVAIAALFVAVIARAAVLCKRQKSPLAQLVAVAIITTQAAQVLLYVMTNLGFSLFQVLSLPLIAGGGLALVVNMLFMGLLFSALKTGTRQKRQCGTAP